MSTILQLTARLRPTTARRRPRSAWLPLLLLLSLALSTAVHAAVHAQFKYAKENGAITITGYTGAGDVTIPSTLEGLQVTAIANAAFASNHYLRGVTIPSGVTSIGDAAFSDCHSWV